MLHVVGAGLAGLAAATAAAKAGQPVTLHEATDHAGGRCRSYHDAQLGLVIDNGTHLVMDVNRTALAFAACVGGLPQMRRGKPVYPFVDLASGQSWTLTPWALLRRPGDLIKALGLFGLNKHTSVTAQLGATPTFSTIWDPLNVAALNTESETASAWQFAQLLRLALRRGLSSLNPWVFPAGLSAAFVDPAVAALTRWGVDIRFHHRLRQMDAHALVFEDETLQLAPEDRVILAVPPWIARDLLPHLPHLATRAIVNGHFRLDRPAHLPGGMPWLGLTGGLGQWVSLRDNVVSVTVSAAEHAAKQDADLLARQMWAELAPLLQLPASPLPPHRIVKEKRATLAHTPAMVALRPSPKTPYDNVVLAGDWLESPWPCTIEAAILSGLNAARRCCPGKALRY